MFSNSPLLPFGNTSRLGSLFCQRFLVDAPSVRLSHIPSLYLSQYGYLVLQQEKAVTLHINRSRRYTYDVWEVKLVRCTTQLF
jgi:hypothetical protein